MDVEIADKQPVPTTDKQFVVQGTVRYADGRPFTGCLVRAYDRDLRSEEPLSEATTDEDGCYQIRYTAKNFARAEKHSADLVVRVFNSKQDPMVSEASFKAQDVQNADLVVLASDSVHERPSRKKLPGIDDPDFFTRRGCVSLFGVFLAFIAAAGGIFYALQGYTKGLLLVIVFLLAGILLVVSTKANA